MNAVSAIVFGEGMTLEGGNDNSPHARWYPEVVRFGDLSEQASALKRAGAQPIWLYMLIGGISGAVGGFFSSGFVRGLPISSLSRHIAMPMIIAVITIVLIILFTMIGAGRVRRRLRADLIRRGVPICLECGYDLRGCPGSRCPECGAEPALISSVADQVNENDNSHRRN